MRAGVGMAVELSYLAFRQQDCQHSDVGAALLCSWAAACPRFLLGLLRAVCGPYLPHAAHHHSSLRGDMQLPAFSWPSHNCGHSNFLLVVRPSNRAQKGFKNAFNLLFTLQRCLVPSCAPQLAACIAGQF